MFGNELKLLAYFSKCHKYPDKDKFIYKNNNKGEIV